MGFLSPWFLAGLAAIGLPVYFHLLRQHKSTPLKFSSLMFFEQSTQSSVRHRRLRYLLLMASRILLLVLLALAFAGPYLMQTLLPGQAGRSQLLLVVDNSFSMREGGRLEQATDEALGVLSNHPDDQEAQVATLGSQMAFLTEPTLARAEMIAAIRSIELSDARSSFGELARALRAMADSSREPIEVHLFSDMQRTSLPGGFADLQLPVEAALILHPVVEDESPNFAVENVIAPSSLFDPATARVQATISGYNTAAASRTVSLVANGAVLASTEVDVPANGRGVAEFVSLDVGYGFNRCEVRIDAGDMLHEDDRFLFAVERADPREVLFVHAERDSRSLLYFRAAVDASINAGFRLQPVTASNAGGIDPARFSVVVVSDVESLPGNFEEALGRYVRAGGSVLLTAGPNMAANPRVPVLGAPILQSNYASRGGARFHTAGDLDPTHPALASVEGWEAIKFYHAVQVQEGDGRVAARLADGTPLLIETQMGEGRLLLFTSTFNNTENDLPLNPSFVPFVEHTLRYLARVEERTSSVAVSSFVSLRIGGAQTGAVEVVDPDGSRPLSLEEAAERDSFQVNREGFYELRRSSGRNEMVAVNADRREADLSLTPPETLALWQNTGEGATEAGAEAVERQRQWPIGWYFLLLVLVAVIGESLLAGRYLTLDREAA